MLLAFPCYFSVDTALSADFGNPVDVSNGSVNGVTALDAADFNGDGLLDIAAACGGAHSDGGKLYAWFEQKTDGTWLRHEFGNSSNFDDFVGSAKCADIDGDGDQDFILAIDGHTTGPIKIQVFENPGVTAVTGSWNNHTIATINGEHANDMQIADMDGDGKLDVIIRHKEPHDVIVAFQNTTTSWTVKVVGNKNGEGLSVGDLNGDGRPDISVSGDWFKAPSSPRTQAYTKFTLYGYSNIATKEDIGDINGDGRPDVLLSPAESFSYYGTPGSHDLAWFENPGNPESVSSWTKHVVQGGVNDLSFTRLGDFDGDGDLDIASGKDFSGTGNYVKVYYNDALSFSRNVTLASGKGIYSGAVKDMDGDGDIDLVGESDYAASSKPYFYKNLTGPYATSSPEAPTALSAPIPSGSNIDLSWQDNSSNEMGFKLERKASGGAFLQIAQTGAGINQFGDVGLQGVSYTYRVSAYNAVGASAYSNEFTVSVPLDTTSPAIASVVGVSNSEVRVTFDKAVTTTSAQTTSNYSIDNGIIVSSAVLQSDQRTAILTVGSLASGLEYTLTANGVRDLSNANNIVNSSAAFIWSSWMNQDIGAVAASGGVTFEGTSFTVTGSGVDIYGTADEFHFVYQSLAGDGEIIARVVSQVENDPYSKAGVMIRESLDANSKHALIALAPGSGIEFNSRDVTGGTTNNPGMSGPVDPYWVKLTRTGNILTGFASPDGSTWTQVASRTVSMGTNVLVGMAVSSHSDGQISTAVFDNVVVSSQAVPSGPVAPLNLRIFKVGAVASP